MDDIVSMLLSPQEKHLHTSLLKVQQNVISIVGLLCKIWDQIEKVDKSVGADLSLPLFKELAEKTVLLMAQSIHSVMYQRRLYALNAIENDSKNGYSAERES